MELKKLLEFIQLTQTFRDVERKVILRKTQRHENDAEHSFQLALAAWYIAAADNLDLDTALLVKYAIAHDLVEVYAGDTPMSSTDKAYVASKHARETEAQEKIEKEFPEFAELHAIIRRYEERGDRESRLVYALDKLLPPLNIYLENGHSWKENAITLDMVVDHKAGKIELSPEIKKYFDALLEILRKDETLLFPEKKSG